MASEVEHQASIEWAFDRAEAGGRLRDFEHALEWLDRAEVLGGGLPPAYRLLRLRWTRELGRLRP